MRSRASPRPTAYSALSSAETTSASRITSSASSGFARAWFSSIMRASSSGSSEPQFTPMRTGLPYSIAFSIMVENWSSRFEPWPTLPGLMRYLSSTWAHSGTCARSLWPLKWKSPTSGTATPIFSRRLRIPGTWRAASSVFTVMRTISEPARASAATCSAVDAASSVSVLVIDCTRMGAPPPMILSATRTGREWRRDCIGLFESEARDRDPGMGLERDLAVVVEDGHVGRVADHDVEWRPARHLGLAAGIVQLRQQHLAAPVPDLDPRRTLEAKLERARAGRGAGCGLGCGGGGGGDLDVLLLPWERAGERVILRRLARRHGLGRRHRSRGKVLRHGPRDRFLLQRLARGRPGTHEDPPIRGREREREGHAGEGPGLHVRAGEPIAQRVEADVLARHHDPGRGARGRHVGERIERGLRVQAQQLGVVAHEAAQERALGQALVVADLERLDLPRAHVQALRGVGARHAVALALGCEQLAQWHGGRRVGGGERFHPFPYLPASSSRSCSASGNRR